MIPLKLEAVMKKPELSDYEVCLSLTRTFFGAENPAMARGLERIANLMNEKPVEEDHDYRDIP